MNIFLWVLQILLALHTLMGALWKFSNSAQTLPSLSLIPHPIWIAMSAFEILFALGLVLPAIKKSLGILAPVSALCVLAEMLFFTAVHFYSGTGNDAEVGYWLVVAAFCAFIAYARFVLKPIK